MRIVYDGYLSSPEETETLAETLGATCVAPQIIYLEGALGAGKTTFARGFLRGAGWVDTVTSPTFTLVESYEVGKLLVFHFDLYRLEQPSDILDIGIEDYLQSNAILLLEWPEKGLPYIPDANMTVCLSRTDEHSRKIIIKTR
jgi:tRNA threonylcarbamoyladenosine biosynthesis protein TsaE